MAQNTKEAKRHYRLAQKAADRLSTSTRKDQTTLTIIRHLKAAILSDGDQ